MKFINIHSIFLKKIILFLLIFLWVSNISVYSYILSPINIKDNCTDYS